MTDTASHLMHGCSLPGHEARRLLAAATGVPHSVVPGLAAVGIAAVSRFQKLVLRRLSGEPLQYIEGTVDFANVVLAVDSRVLIPRPETEQLWEKAVQRVAASPPSVVVDLGTGSGNLAIALAAEFPAAEVHAADLSLDALEVAKQNAADNGVAVEFHNGDLYSALPRHLEGRVDLIIANPPYIAVHERDSLPNEVTAYEPSLALFAGDRGLDALARIVGEAGIWLGPQGLMACEIGSDQSQAVRSLDSVLHLSVETDLAGHPRFLFGAVR